jgi:hypothetical protein
MAPLPNALSPEQPIITEDMHQVLEYLRSQGIFHHEFYTDAVGVPIEAPPDEAPGESLSNRATSIETIETALENPAPDQIVILQDEVPALPRGKDFLKTEAGIIMLIMGILIFLAICCGCCAAPRESDKEVRRRRSQSSARPGATTGDVEVQAASTAATEPVAAEQHELGSISIQLPATAVVLARPSERARSSASGVDGTVQDASEKAASVIRAPPDYSSTRTGGASDSFRYRATPGQSPSSHELSHVENASRRGSPDIWEARHERDRQPEDGLALGDDRESVSSDESAVMVDRPPSYCSHE